MWAVRHSRLGLGRIILSVVELVGRRQVCARSLAAHSLDPVLASLYADQRHADGVAISELNGAYRKSTSIPSAAPQARSLRVPYRYAAIEVGCKRRSCHPLQQSLFQPHPCQCCGRFSGSLPRRTSGSIASRRYQAITVHRATWPAELISYPPDKRSGAADTCGVIPVLYRNLR